MINSFKNTFIYNINYENSKNTKESYLNLSAFGYDKNSNEGSFSEFNSTVLSGYLFFFVMDGEYTVTSKNSSKLFIHSSQVAVFKPKEYVKIIPSAESNNNVFWFILRGTALPSILNELNITNGKCYKINSVKSLVADFVQLYDIFKYYDHNSYETKINSHILSALSAINRLPYYNIPDSEKAIENAKMYIENSYANPITIKELAKTYNLSECYFVKLFKKRNGTSPYQYLINVRLKNACYLLRSTDSPIEEVAWQVGFNSTIQFHQLFKNRYEMTPLEYRKLS